MKTTSFALVALIAAAFVAEPAFAKSKKKRSVKPVTTTETGSTATGANTRPVDANYKARQGMGECVMDLGYGNYKRC